MKTKSKPQKNESTIETVAPIATIPTVQSIISAVVDAPDDAAVAKAPITVLKDAVKDAKKNSILSVSKEIKELIQGVSAEFVGPGKTKEYPLTEKETVDLLWHVANNARFQAVPVLDEEGLVTYDEDGGMIMESRDLFAIEAKRVFAMRDVPLAKADKNSPEALRAEMARIQAKLQALGLA